MFSVHSGRRTGIPLVNDSPNHGILQACSCLRAFLLAVPSAWNAVHLDLHEPASHYSVLNLHVTPLEKTLKVLDLG